MARRFGEKRVAANMVYMEYIKDRNAVHMKATMWQTLTSFVKYLGKKGVCVVDETEKVILFSIDLLFCNYHT